MADHRVGDTLPAAFWKLFRQPGGPGQTPGRRSRRCRAILLQLGAAAVMIALMILIAAAVTILWPEQMHQWMSREKAGWHNIARLVAQQSEAGASKK
jgi:hypothetical protein